MEWIIVVKLYCPLNPVGNLIFYLNWRLYTWLGHILQLQWEFHILDKNNAGIIENTIISKHIYIPTESVQLVSEPRNWQSCVEQLKSKFSDRFQVVLHSDATSYSLFASAVCRHCYLDDFSYISTFVLYYYFKFSTLNIYKI